MTANKDKSPPFIITEYNDFTTIDFPKLEYKNHSIEQMSNGYFMVYDLANPRQAIWEDLSLEKCKAWIDKKLKVL